MALFAHTDMRIEGIDIYGKIYGAARAVAFLVNRSYHIFKKMVYAHCCVRDEGGFTVHWLVVVFRHWVGVRVRC